MPQSLRVPPGLQGRLPLLGALPTLIIKPLDFYRRMTLDYGPISYAKLGKLKLYVLRDPDLIDELLVEHGKDCVKDAITRTLVPLVGHGLLTSEGELWRRQRKLSAQPFTPRRLVPHETAMVEAAELTCSELRDGEQRDFHRDAMTITLNIVCKTLLGEVSAHEASRIGAVIDVVLGYYEERLLSWGKMLPPSFPTFRQLRFFRAKRELDRIVRAIIARARQQGPSGSDNNLLAKLMASRTETGQAMDEQQLLDEVCTILLAGHETTALTLMYTVYLLSRHPEVAARVRDEVDRELAGRRATMDDLARLPYLDAVLRECLRLYPPAYAFARETVQEFELGGYRIPVGSQVVMSPFGLHRNPRYFPNPERFDPERWIGPDAAKLPRHAYIPFGAGHRVCIGSHFALMEAGLVLATMAQQVELTVPADFKMELAPVITLRSRHGLPVRVHRRAVRVKPQPTAATTRDTAVCPHAAAAASGK